MKLADLLAESSDDDLERLAHDHARADDEMPRPQLLATIEGVLRSHRFLQDFLINRLPPTFGILTVLLDSDELRVQTRTFKEVVLQETHRISESIDAGEILNRDDQLRVYRRVLYQARSNDLRIDDTESAILGVLRHELDITQVEHFLIEHHADLREFWPGDAAFLRELHALRSAGLVYERDGYTIFPEDLAKSVRQVLGLDMSREDAARLYSKLSSSELHDVLTAADAPTSGTKQERIERLLAHRVQPRCVLRSRSLGIARLRDICKEIGALVSGSKEELIERIIQHVGADEDIAPEQEAETPVREPRRLDQERFGLLFSRLRVHELAAILSELELSRWGSKEHQVRTLWEAERAEATLLGLLLSVDLEGLLRRLGLKTAGSKVERMGRAIQHFVDVPIEQLRAAASVPFHSPDGQGEGGIETGHR